MIRAVPTRLLVVLPLFVGSVTSHGQSQNSGATHPAITSSAFIYERAPFPSAHASTIVDTNQGLVASWFGGTGERHPDVGIWVSRHEGGRWTAPVEVANGVQPDKTRQPTWNPVLHQAANGPLYLFYKVGPSPKDWWGLVRTSSDDSRTWSAPHTLPKGILGPIRAKPIVLTDGTLLAGSSTEDKGWVVHMERTRDPLRRVGEDRPAERSEGVRCDTADDSRARRFAAADSVSERAGCHHRSVVGGSRAHVGAHDRDDAPESERRDRRGTAGRRPVPADLQSDEERPATAADRGVSRRKDVDAVGDARGLGWRVSRIRR